MDFVTALLSLAALVISIVALLFSHFDRKRAVLRATVDYWASTHPARTALREKLPYESEVKDRDAIQRLIKDPSSGFTEHEVTAYLSLFETLGSGVRHQLFDLEVTRTLDGPRIVEIWFVYGRWIAARREQTGKGAVYFDLEWLARQLLPGERDRLESLRHDGAITRRVFKGAMKRLDAVESDARRRTTAA